MRVFVITLVFVTVTVNETVYSLCLSIIYTSIIFATSEATIDATHHLIFDHNLVKIVKFINKYSHVAPTQTLVSEYWPHLPVHHVCNISCPPNCPFCHYYHG